MLLGKRTRKLVPVTITLTAGSGNTTLPADFPTDGDFTVKVWGDGASGGAGGSTNYESSGGGGAFSSEIGTNLAGWLPGVSIPYSVGPGGAPVSSTGSGVVGNDGQNSWIGIGATNLANSQVGAEGGKKGNIGVPPANASGGLAANGKGSVKFSGGSSISGATTPGGGGGAAGPDGNGANGSSGGTGVGFGGNGDNGSGGTGGGNTNTTANGGNGASNTNGGGGGGTAYTASGTCTGGNGGFPGGGSGSGSASGTNLGTSGTPGAGKIEITYF